MANDKNAGFRTLAAMVLGIAGVMRIFDSIWAFRNHGVLPENFEGALFGHSLKTYGWIYLIVGIILIVAAFGVMSGSQFSRWIGIIAGALLAISSVWWMPYYPVWSLVYVALGILIVYAMVAYGGHSADEQSTA